MATSGAAQEIIRERDKEIAKIRGFVDLTEEAKNRRIGEIRQWAQEEYEKAKSEEQRQRQLRLERTKKAVYKIPTGRGSDDAEIAQIYQAYRAAYSDVRAATEGIKENPVLANAPQATKRLEPLLDQAERSGDELLARAIYHRAIDLGAQEIVDRFLSTRKTDALNWQNYTEAAAEVRQASGIEALLADGFTERALSG